MRPVGILQTKNFASGVSGWKISAEGNGTAEFENAVIRGTLRTTTFEKESVNAVGGQLWIANSTTISASFVSASATTMSVANASGYVAGEILMSKKIDNTGFTKEYILVNSSSVDGDGSGTDSTFGRLMVTRGYDSGSTGDFVGGVSGISQSYTDGQVLVSTGKLNSGSGYIKMNASPNDTATPFIDITERTGSGVYDVLLKARLGDLSGLSNSDMVFNKPNPGFGLATDNVFLQGGIKATFGDIGGFGITNNTISSSNNNIILKSSGQITASDGFLFGNKASSNYVAHEGGTLTVRGDLTVDNIKTPAIINSNPSTEANASASINADGFASFKSASIAGFTVNTEEIKSSDNSLRLKSNGQITGSKVLFDNGVVGGFGILNTGISSTNNNLQLLADGTMTASGGFIFGDKSTNQYVEYDGSELVVKGDISVNNIFTPSGTDVNTAKAAITEQGFAKFISASIGGFEISANKIRSGFTEASSSTSTKNTNVDILFTVPSTTTAYSTSTTVTGITTGASNGNVFNNAYIKAGSPSVDHFYFGGSGASIGRISAINKTTGALTLAAGYQWGTYYDETPANLTYRLYTDSGATNANFVSSSISTTNFPVTESITIDSANNRISIIDGEITASRGIIGGTEITPTLLQSKNDISPLPAAGSNGRAFQLKSEGTISGSNLYIRKVISTDGTNNIVYPLFDSEQGLVDGKNIGRSIAASYGDQAHSNADDGPNVAPQTVAAHVVQLMPYENNLIFNFGAQVINANIPAGVVTGAVGFVVEKQTNSGSFLNNNTAINDWTAVGNVIQNIGAASASPWQTSYIAVGALGLSLQIPESAQAQAIRISVNLGVNPNAAAGGAAAGNVIQLKYYSITATRALAVASSGNPSSALPSKDV